ncbi:MAG TPA: EamA family transporter [Nocardioidaceae bacterium]|nr:EamA family transporter [Nocardioidaceae bacterium]
MAQLTEASARSGVVSHPFGSALLVLAGASLFGTVGTAQALGPDVPASSLAASRLLVTALAFACIAMALGRSHGVLAATRHVPTWLAGLGQASFNLCFLAAMTHAGVAVGTLVAIGATPIITGLVARHVTRLWLFATAVAVAGLGLLVGGQQAGPLSVSPVGVLLALGAAASYATYIVAGNAAERRGLETQSFLAAAFTVSALATLPWLLVGSVDWVGTADGALLLGYLVLVPTILSYSLFNRGLRGIRSSTASTLGLVEPVIAATLAWFVLDERLTRLGLVGAVLILIGLLLIVRSAAVRPMG